MARAGQLIVLPMFMTWENRIRWGWVMYAFASFIYLSTNHFPLRTPALLPMTPLDAGTPFLPWTIWLYISEYVFFAAVYLTASTAGLLNRYFYAFLAVQVLSCAVFIAFPTTYPRDLFPLPPGLDAVTAKVFAALRATDSPNNCFPSLHVSSVYLSCFMFLEEYRARPRVFWGFFAWGTVIALSTMTTKQHYLADVVSGLLLGGAAYWFFYRSAWVSYGAAPLGGAHANR